MHARSRARKALSTAVPVALAATLALGQGASAFAASTNSDPGSLEQANAELSRSAASEGAVLLENHNHALPLAKGGNVAVFGVGSYATVKGGTGSGQVNNRYSVNVRDGLTNAGFTVTTSDAYYQTMKTAFDTKYPSSNGIILGSTVDYSSVEQALTRTTVKPTEPTDDAIFVVARNSGEGADRKAVAGDYELTDIELNNIQLIGQTYKNVTVVLNVGGIVDTTFYSQINKAANDPDGDSPIDALVLMSQLGQEGGNVLADVLDGAVVPSGKLVDTWASKYSLYPASATFASNDGDSLHEQYSEGIYVGYRYFDSYAKTLGADAVNYPFGYGLSYTDFQIDTQSVKADGDAVTVKARVTNVGTKSSGKEVVQVYFSAPAGSLDKPYQELAGFAKTDVLKPGQAQTVTITFNTEDMASYDTAKAAYVMEKGDYLIRVGNSSRNSHVVAKVALAADVLTEQLSNQDNDATPANELKASPANFYSYQTEAGEVAAATTLTLDPASVDSVDNASELAQNVTVDSSSPYYAIDKDKISSIKAYLPEGQTDWEGTGAPYAPKAGETVEAIATDPTTTLYDVAKGKASMEKFVAGLSVTQLGNIVEGATAAGSTLSAVGAAGYTTAKYESLGIPAMSLADGPAGLRITQKIATTPATYQFGTAWPIGTALAQTWNLDVVERVGIAIGKEMREYGVTLWLAPGMNIHRDPLNGRNFEYYSEDPLLTGLDAAAVTAGVQSNAGVGVTLKHYIANNQETSRNTTDAVISERAEREIYLKGFEIAVKSAQPMAIMSSYNKVNGTYTAGSYDVLTDILRGEWGFEGLVMTDWGGVRAGIVNTMYAGNDLIEPGNAPNDPINAIKKNPPLVDINGLPVFNKLITLSNNRTTYSWMFNGITPSATGAETFTTVVDATTDLTKVPASITTTRSVINNETVEAHAKYASVDEAYKEVANFKANATGSTVGLTAAQAAGITISDVRYATDGDNTTPVVAYTVTIKGNYPTAGYNMRLGDLQRSARAILNVAMQTAQFKQLAGIQSVSGISVGSYTKQFDDLSTYLTQARGKVGSVSASGPAFTVKTSPAAPASGWFTGDVTVSVDLPNPDSDVAYIDVETGELRTYTGPVKVSGEGLHLVKVLAVDEDGVPSQIKELQVRIDATAPVAKVDSAESRVLKLSASDALSGVASIEYSVNGGLTWQRYTAPATIPTAPVSVQYRATDLAGNVSVAKSVTVKGSLSLANPSVSGTVKVGKTVKAKVSSYTSGAKLSYQWYRSGKAISGATKSSYKLVKSDKGKKVSVKVTD
ncbi:MAG: glycoside hydrolase family 3 N-terminal domain-containing protein, partial [Propionicimonas sp.]